MTKRFWQNFSSWQEAEKKWDEKAEEAKREHPLKVLNSLPKMPGMTEETKKHLKWKSLLWMFKKDANFAVMRHVVKRPFFHLRRYVQSLVKKKPYRRDGDFFLYGIESVDAFKVLLQRDDTFFVLGFSYCEKPHECPSGRFTPDCIHDLESPVCQQCFIGKCVHSLDEKKSTALFIPTIHYIAKKIFEIVEAHPDKQVIFMITACEMTLEMFGDWGNMAGVRGIGVRLDGRICNTMRAFELSEEGIKPGLTVVLENTKQRMLDILKCGQIARDF